MLDRESRLLQTREGNTLAEVRVVRQEQPGIGAFKTQVVTKYQSSQSELWQRQRSLFTASLSDRYDNPLFVPLSDSVTNATFQLAKF